MPLFHEGINWTTDEQVHPSMKLNGAPVYYKYVDFGALPNDTTKTVAHGITGLDRVLPGSLFVGSAADNIERPMSWFSSVTSSVSWRVEPVNIFVIVNGNWSTATGRAYLIYTKT